ncbi:MAG: AAA family ATPase [Spirochaetes bacterium]|nr:AAA family ATPase [Spirochaetota bacterium]
MRTEFPNHTIILAVCGKGGVGKTTIAASMVRELVKLGEKKILAIDADPAVGLATALAVCPEKTVNDIRDEVIELIKKGNAGERKRVRELIDYEMMGALSEKGNLAFLAIGRPETEGCYCQVNELLKEIISQIASNFDYVIIDAEAGIEQVNRRVLEHVTHLVLVSDLSVKGINVAKAIREVAREAVKFHRIGLVLNKVRQFEENSLSIPREIPYLGEILECDEIRDADKTGKSFFEIAENPVFKAVREFLARLNIIEYRLCEERVK